MMFQQQQQQQQGQQQQGANSISSKELNYITDNMKNEELLAKLCVQGAAQIQNAQLRHTMEQMAQGHVQSYQHLLNTLQQQG